MPTFENRDGYRLFFHDWGQGRPLAFVHGGALNADCWEYQMLPLAERGYRCVAPDTRGCGRSEQPFTGYGYDDLADDLADLIANLRLQEVVLVGHSMAAGTITRYLTRHGTSRIAQVVLVAPTTPYMLRSDDNPLGVPRAVFEDSVRMLRRDRPLWIDMAAPAFFGADDRPEAFSQPLVDWGKGLALSSGARATIELFGNFYDADLRDEMTNFTMPTLVLHGDADRTAPLELCGRPTSAAIPKGTLRIYDGGSHGIFLSHAAQVNDDIVDFLGR